jgi:hypothetical protein
MMQKVIMLTISGTIFLFEDNDFTIDQKIELQEIAQTISVVNDLSEHEVCKQFLDVVLAMLEIDLHEIKISFVLRINI